MSRAQIKMDSKIGPLYLVVSDKGLQGIFWKIQDAPMLSVKDRTHATLLTKATTQIAEYLDGKRKEFELPLDPRGTDFQKSVWRALAKIPYGETRSYKEIAIALNDPNASRAVGNANGKNPLSIIVPCHRVIASNGTMGGYAGGLTTKESLLDLEKNSNKTG
jgi:methylated-DNA-[protein]-cysteine S-methyltransferase